MNNFNTVKKIMLQGDNEQVNLQQEKLVDTLLKFDTTFLFIDIPVPGQAL